MSETYADLGGGIRTFVPRPPARTTPPAERAAEPHVCSFDATSGYCRCGIRDDGTVAEGSPAWRARRAGAAA